MTAPTMAMPDLLGRNDFDNGSWSVDETLMAPGQAWTMIADRKMQVPNGDTELERTVRAHEMMHAKISPVDVQPWLNRSKAPLTAMKSVEEMRVNLLIKRLGFDVDKIADGTEVVGGEFAAKNDRWAQAVYDAVACAGTGRLTEYLKGVRRHNPEWAKVLKAFTNRLLKLAEKVPNDQLASTAVHPRSGLAPYGYSFTEAWAQMVEAVANPPQPPQDDLHEQPSDQQDQPSDPDDAGEAPATNGEQQTAKPAPITEDQAKKMAQVENGSFWAELIVERCPMPRTSPGGLGKKRRASSLGRVPRRINRMLTDPDRKVFDSLSKSLGGVVLIDASGSMQLTQDDIKRICEAAPGATVAMYCCSDSTVRDNRPNLFVLADKGRMVNDIPERVSGNGVDAPAARWAIEHRHSRRSPVVWITDGLVHGPGQRYTHAQGLECADLALANGIIVRPDVDSAVDMLTDLAKGRKPRRWYPSMWRRTYREVVRRELPNQIESFRDRVVRMR